MPTYWRGQECPARRLLVRVKGSLEAVPAVEVIAGGRCFYLDDRDGSAWLILTYGLGAACFEVRELLGIEEALTPSDSRTAAAAPADPSYAAAAALPSTR